MPGQSREVAVSPAGTPTERRPHRLGLAMKFALVFLALGAVELLSQHLLDPLYSRSARVTAEAIDRQGQLRYLTQLIAHQAALLDHRDRADAREALRRAIGRFDSLLAEQKDRLRDEWGFLAAIDPGLDTHQAALNRRWQAYRTAAETVAGLPVAADDARRAGAFIVRESATLLLAADRVVKSLVAAAGTNAERIDVLRHVAAVGQALLLVLVFVYLRRRVVHPLVALADMTRRFAAGERQVRVAFDSRDEIGNLVRNANRTAEQVTALLQVQERLGAIVETTRDVVFSIEPDGTLGYVNRSARQLLGLAEAGPAAGIGATEIYPDWAMRVMQATAMPAAARDGSWEGELALCSRGGREVPVSQVLIAHREGDVRIAYYSVIARDISARIAMEARLTESRDFYLRLFHGFPNLIWRSRPDGNCDYFNKAWLDFTGRTLEQELGDGWTEGVHPDDRSHCLTTYGRALERRQPFHMEYRLRHADGGYRWIADYGAPFFDEDGVFAGYVGSCYDLTDRLDAEQTLRLWGRALESSVNAVVITEMGGDNPIVYANPAFKRITGYPVQEALGRSCGFLQAGDSEQPALEEIRKALREQREGKALLRNYRRDGTLFWNELHIAPVRNEAGALTHYVGVLNDVTEHKLYEAELERQANSDALTGLPNRNLLSDRLAQLLIYCGRSGGQAAVLFLDLDHFKNINDSLGHGAGDRLLQAVAERIAGCIRQVDTVARQGGDEFVVLLADVQREEDVSGVARKIVQALSEPYQVDGHELFVTCSIGIALSPRDGETSEVLLRNADTAMYRAKERGRGTFQFYTAEMNRKVTERLLLEAELRRAVERNELVLHYQPRLDLMSGEVTGVEALVRWLHPERGLVPPNSFIPLAEETGLIVPIGEWVLNEACRQAQAWRASGLADLVMAVNVSARQLRQEHLEASVAAALERSGLPADRLELELTESLLMNEPEVVAGIVRRLRAGGTRFAIDDFGTGYSSLAYLSRFPVDALKIDQSFVRDLISDPDDAAIAAAVISLAHDLALRVIAEGVETGEQLAFLRNRGCDEIQGYYFSRPLPAAELEALLAEGRSLPGAAADAGAGPVLLLLDDEENVLSALYRTLRRDGYRILRARSAEEAFESLALHPVEVILSDQRMPGMSGVEFLRRVKQFYPDTIRIVISGYTDIKTVTEAVNEGAVFKFITKPWDDRQLRAHVREAFRLAAQRRERAGVTLP